jgi:hypothetical protein
VRDDPAALTHCGTERLRNDLATEASSQKRSGCEAVKETCLETNRFFDAFRADPEVVP